MLTSSNGNQHDGEGVLHTKVLKLISPQRVFILHWSPLEKNKGPESRALLRGHWYFPVYLLIPSYLHLSNKDTWGLGPSCAVLGSPLGHKVCTAAPWMEGELNVGEPGCCRHAKIGQQLC